jgi:hypothetical protein
MPMPSSKADGRVARDDDARVLIGKLADALPAAAARGAETGSVGTAAGHRNRHDALTACRDHRGDCAGFGAAALRIGCVLDIATSVYLAVFVD